MLVAFTVLLCCQLAGAALAAVLHLPIPGPVIGMILLFGVLVWRPTAIDRVAPAVDLLLKHLSLLYIPVGVGVMAAASEVDGRWSAIIAAVAGSSIVGIAVTAWVTRALMRRMAPSLAPSSAPVPSTQAVSPPTSPPVDRT